MNMHTDKDEKYQALPSGARDWTRKRSEERGGCKIKETGV